MKMKRDINFADDLDRYLESGTTIYFESVAASRDEVSSSIVIENIYVDASTDSYGFTGAYEANSQMNEGVFNPRQSNTYQELETTDGEFEGGFLQFNPQLLEFDFHKYSKRRFLPNLFTYSYKSPSPTQDENTPKDVTIKDIRDAVRTGKKQSIFDDTYLDKDPESDSFISKPNEPKKSDPGIKDSSKKVNQSKIVSSQEEYTSEDRSHNGTESLFYNPQDHSTEGNKQIRLDKSKIIEKYKNEDKTQKENKSDDDGWFFKFLYIFEIINMFKDTDIMVRWIIAAFAGVIVFGYIFAQMALGAF